MRIGILETGKVAAELAETHGDYPAIFRALLRRADPALGFDTWDVQAGVLPASPTACDAWLITGSKHGVYDALPWIAPLKGFLRATRAAGVPMVGVCFGHQIVAEALGGRAVKSDRGWAVGVKRYDVLRRPGWMAGAGATVAFHAHHQDQVVALPEDATVLAANDSCPVAMAAYGDPERPDAITIQPHPEFTAGYASDLLTRRTGVSVPEAVAAPAQASFGQPVDGDLFADWVRAYLRAVLEDRAAA